MVGTPRRLGLHQGTAVGGGLVIEVTQDIVISTNTGEVFAFITDPERRSLLMPAAYEIDQLVVKPNGLYLASSHVTGRRGTVVSIESELLERVADRRTVGVQRTVPFRLGRCEALVIRDLEPVAGGTRLTTRVRFDIAPRLYGMYLSLLQRDKFMLSVHRANEWLKDALEHPAPAT